MTSKQEWHRARAAELHDEGAARFGWLWVHANELTSTAAYKADIEEFSGREIHILSVVAYAICEQEERRTAQPAETTPTGMMRIVDAPLQYPDPLTHG